MNSSGERAELKLTGHGNPETHEWNEGGRGKPLKTVSKDMHVTMES